MMKNTPNYDALRRLVCVAPALLALALTASTSLAQADDAPQQRVLRVYDVSDLLPTAALRDQPWTDWRTGLQSPRESGETSSDRGDAKASAPASARDDMSSASDGAQRVFDVLTAAATGESAVRIAPNLALVKATEEQHRALAEAVDQLRTAYAQRVVATVSIRALAADVAPPRVGDILEDEVGEALFVSSQSVRRRLPTVFSRELSRTVVETFTPIVGTGSATLNPYVEQISMGVRIVVRVGSAQAEGSPVTARGWLRWADASQRSVQGSSGQAIFASDLDLPVQAIETFTGDALAPADREVVVAVTGGELFALPVRDEPLGWAVVTIRIEPAP